MNHSALYLVMDPAVKQTNPDENVFMEFDRLYYVMNPINRHVYLIGEKDLREPSDELNFIFGVPTIKDVAKLVKHDRAFRQAVIEVSDEIDSEDAIRMNVIFRLVCLDELLGFLNGVSRLFAYIDDLSEWFIPPPTLSRY
ncbi:hypothetical protein RRU94_17820 [Domibacillus sp. DTU_2020_1001157_1_SI_ALB_TIR_016]|uniref:hypothetical protein n=1 Tax=Domibacillus sp. DTU_2020_1001157_1_SI_ALB_TIR_016 TaxID=3077789 RepID=UPI0028EF90D9|nr:hypothetical protein [Domibacillus sp. DTU_2020_1001157_1_SI_ALB_TIR_016]WNS79394.1 hypothetical protein RRU94_17820 [Domibacillus sp. DTU_2020_1001157_1_SI_ALB_TIR_016]